LLKSSKPENPEWSPVLIPPVLEIPVRSIP
jgi:hypothetical protein